MVNVTVNGIIYNTDDFRNFGYFKDFVAGNGESYPEYIAIMTDFVADFAKGLKTTSASSVLIGTGAKTFVLALQIPVTVGGKGIAVDRANSANVLYFDVTSWTPGTKTLLVNVTEYTGSGTISDWDIQLGVGPKGVAGAGIANVVEDLTPELGGNLDALGRSIINAVYQDGAVEYFDAGNVSGAVVLDYTNGSSQKITLTGNISSLTINNWPASGLTGILDLLLKQDGTGGRTITLSSAYKTSNGEGVTLTTTPNAEDIISLKTPDGGTTIYTVCAKDFK